MKADATVHEARDWVHAGAEIAFLDVREAGQFGEGHPLFAVPCPYSRLELLAPRLVPRHSAPVLLIDEGDGVAHKAVRRLSCLGYADVRIVEGGAAAWAAAGFTLFKGVNVPSKALGELAEEAWHPPTLPAQALQDWRRVGRPFHLFDARPPEEYARMRVPGAACMPNGELAHRFAALVPDADTPVVVTCAGRTRGIVGITGLRLAGVGNPVFALENGTQGWALAGYHLERGNRAEPYPELNEGARAASEARAQAFSQAQDISWIRPHELARMRAERERSLFLFDVRSREEALGDPVPGAVHAPGGQLVQATDQWVGVRHGRIVLCDDTGLRASLAAFWLRQLGYEAFVLPIDDNVRAMAAPERPSPPALAPLPGISPAAAWARMAEGAARLLDLRSSGAHREARPSGAAWAIRPRIGAVVGSDTRPVVLLADEAAVAGLAAIDLEELGVAAVLQLEGGMPAWSAAGLPIASGNEGIAEAIDFLAFVHDRHDGNLDASRRYLAWETGLITQLDPLERSQFSLA